VVNAIVDALRPMGINDIQMPCTPERVWRAIQSAGAAQGAPTTESAQPHFDAGENEKGAGQ
jgi:carbon-monoxide dehydrogenase large subunit